MIRKLTPAQRDMLIAHVDGEVQIDRKKSDGARTALLARGFLRPSTRNLPPRATVLTEEGRRALGLVLGDYADALIRAGVLDHPARLGILSQLKALRASARAADRFFPAIGTPKADVAAEQA